MIRVADYIMKRLQEEDVKHLFYVPGGQCVFLMDALRRNTNISGISVHHEQAAAMAALSYGLYNNNLGACLVTTGCAGTNTVTGVLHAWQDSIPCIFISGQQNVGQTLSDVEVSLRQVGVQEADIVTIVSSITKYAVMVKDAESIAYHVDKAIYLAKNGRKGPVWLDIPLNVQNSMVDEAKLRRFVPEVTSLVPKNEDLDYIIELLNKSSRPVIIAGAGVRSASANEELVAFANKFGIPVVFTRYSVDIVPYDYEYNFGIVSSFSANRYANFMVQNADLILDIGCRLSIDTTGPDQKGFARNAKVIMIDIDENEYLKPGVIIEKGIKADAKEFLCQLEKYNLNKKYNEWIEKCRHWKLTFNNDWSSMNNSPVDLNYFYEKIGQIIPAGSVILSDAGTAGVSVAASCHMKLGSRHLHSHAQGEMGYSLPGAFGAACASNKMVVAFSGDGSIMMNLQELQTLVRNNFNIKVVIINNNGYSGVRHGQKAHFRGKSIGTDNSNGVDFPDFHKIAEAFGIKYEVIENAEQIEEKFISMIKDDDPYICEVLCDPEQIIMHNTFVRYKKDGKWVFEFRPIEDQSPSIDREVFFSEMLVAPLFASYGEVI